MFSKSKLYIPSLEPDPLLALGEEPVVARCALTSLKERKKIEKNFHYSYLIPA